jgi:integrase
LDFADKTDNETAKLIITLGALCGLRRGEMAGLKWENVQLDGFTELHIVETVIEIDGIIYKKPPKTASGIRTVPFGSNVAEILRKAKANYECRKQKYGDDFIDSGYVLNHEKTGLNLMPEAINSRYLRFMKKQAVVPYKNLHMLRHTFASLLASNGVSPKDLQSLLGHADSYTSLQIYTHSYQDVMRDDTIKLDKKIFENGNDENAV